MTRGVVEAATFPRATGAAKYPPKSNLLVIVASFARGRHVPAAESDPEVKSIVPKQGRRSGNATFADLHDNGRGKVLLFVCKRDCRSHVKL